MSSAKNPPRLGHDRLFRTGLISAIIAIVGCLSTHLLVLLGVVSTAAWLGTVEHALFIAAVGFVFLTGYAIWRHRRSDNQADAGCNH